MKFYILFHLSKHTSLSCRLNSKRICILDHILLMQAAALLLANHINLAESAQGLSPTDNFI